MAPAVLNSMVDDETIRSFFEDFKSSVAREEKKRNNEIKMLVQLGKLKAAHVDEYKDEHPNKLDRVYADMYVDKETPIDDKITEVSAAALQMLSEDFLF